jgi:hypothetical protein
MMIMTKFDVGDKVAWGPHEARISGMIISGNNAITYQIVFFDEEGMQDSSIVFDWELKLVERMNEGQGV